MTTTDPLTAREVGDLLRDYRRMIDDEMEGIPPSRLRVWVERSRRLLERLPVEDGDE